MIKFVSNKISTHDNDMFGRMEVRSAMCWVNYKWWTILLRFNHEIDLSFDELTESGPIIDRINILEWLEKRTKCSLVFWYQSTPTHPVLAGNIYRSIKISFTRKSDLMLAKMRFADAIIKS